MDDQLAEATFWSFLTHIHEGVILLDERGQLLHVNPRAQELLQLYSPVRHLAEIARQVDPDGAAHRWDNLLDPPHKLYLTTDLGELMLDARPLVWQGARLIQLLVDGHAAGRQAAGDQNREELLAEINHLRARADSLTRHVAQAERLELLSEASSLIANSVKAHEILTLLGDYFVRLTDGSGYAIYRWLDDGRHVALIVDRAAAAPRYPYETFALSLYPSLRQLRAEHSLLLFEGSSYIPGPPDWPPDALAGQVLVLPLMNGREKYGAIAVALPAGGSDLDENQLQLLSALIYQAGGALERVRLFDDIQERERFLDALTRVSLAVNGTLDLSRVLNLICQESMAIFAVDGVYIWQKPAAAAAGAPLLVGRAAQGYGSERFIGGRIETGEGDLLAAEVFASGRGRFASFRLEDSHLKLPLDEQVRSAMATPLVYQEEILGVLMMVDCQRHARFGQRDLERVNAFALQAANALRNAELVTRLRVLNEELDRRVIERTRDLGQERDRVQWLLRITNELSTSLDEDRVLVRGLELVNEVVHATRGVVVLVEEGARRFVSRAEFGPNGRGRIRRQEMSPELAGLAGWLLEHHQALVVEDMAADPHWQHLLHEEPFHAVLGVPLLTNGEMIGVMMMFHERPGAFTDAQLHLVAAAATHIASAIANAHLFMLIRDQAERLGTMLRGEQISAAKTQAMLESIADGVLVVDERGRVILANSALLAMLEVEREKLVDRPVQELSGLYGSSGRLWLETIQGWTAQDGSGAGRPSLEDTLALTDLKKIVRFHLAPVFVGRQFFGTVTIFRDITKDVEVDRMKTEFVSTVSHELRTPLTVIKGYLDLLLMGAISPLDEEITTHLLTVQQHTNRLQELVNDLLDISRLETGGLKLDLQPVSLPAVLEQVVAIHLQKRIDHEQKSLVTALEIPADLPLVTADPVRVRQMLTNLVDNAFSYTPAGGHILVGAVPEEEGVRIFVQDTGIGIPPENLDKVFDRFFRGEDLRVQQVSGTGLGLPIVRTLVEMHGGVLTVDSRTERGSTFAFTLPLAPEQSGAAQEGAA